MFIIDKLRDRFAEAVIYLDISGRVITSRSIYDLLSRPPSLYDIIFQIKSACKDKRIIGCFMDISASNLDLSCYWEIKKAVEEFRETGRKVVALLRSGGISEVLLADSADEVYMWDNSKIFLLGLAMDFTFFGGLSEKLGISFEVVKSGKLKSVPDMLTKKKLPKSIKEDTERLLNETVDAIKKSLNREKIKKNILSGILDARAALEKGFIDDIVSRAKTARELLTSTFGKATPIFIGRGRKIRQLANMNMLFKTKRKRIASVYLSGIIGSANAQGYGFINPLSFSKMLSRIESNQDIEGVVLRVNSRGGDVGGSEMLFDKISSLSKIKPVAISVGSVAASGGYLIISPATKIFSTPFSIVGSIGVFLVKPFLKKFFDKFGIKNEIVKVGEYADIFQPTKKLTKSGRKMLENMVKKYHSEFIKMVSSTRKIPEKSVERIANGEVFSGEKAKELKLVDEIGGIQDAISWTLSEAGITAPNIEEYPKTKFQDILLDYINPELGEQNRYY